MWECHLLKCKEEINDEDNDDNIKHNNYGKLANFVLFSLFDHFTFNEAMSWSLFEYDENSWVIISFTVILCLFKWIKMSVSLNSKLNFQTRLRKYVTMFTIFIVINFIPRVKYWFIVYKMCI